MYCNDGGFCHSRPFVRFIGNFVVKSGKGRGCQRLPLLKTKRFRVTPPPTLTVSIHLLAICYPFSFIFPLTVKWSTVESFKIWGGVRVRDLTLCLCACSLKIHLGKLHLTFFHQKRLYGYLDWRMLSRGGSRGRVQGVRTPPPSLRWPVVYWCWSRARDECTPS